MRLLSIRTYNTFIHISKHITRHYLQKPTPFSAASLRNGMPNVNQIHTHTKESGNPCATASRVCELLHRRGNWVCLNSNLKAIEVTDAIVEDVLVLLKEPGDARKALLFFHWCSQQRKHRHSVRSYCLMVHILVHAGLLIDARVLMESAIRRVCDSGVEEFAIVEVFENLYDVVQPGPGVFDLLIDSLSKFRMFGLAFEGLCYLEDRGVVLKLSSFNALLHRMVKSDEFDMVWEVFECMLLKRKYPSQLTIEIMIDALCKSGKLQEVIGILDRVGSRRCPPSVVVSTALIMRVIENHKPKDAMVLITRMLQKSLLVDSVAYSLSIHAHCKMGNIEMANSELDEMTKRGLDVNPFVYTSLISLSCLEGRIEEAYRLMNEMITGGLDPYDVTYNELIVWSCRMDKLKKGIKFYNDMLCSGLLPSLAACNAIIGKLCENGKVKQADSMLTVLLDKGLIPDELVYANLINGYGKIHCHQEVMKLYYEMEAKGPSPGLATYTALVKSLSQCGKLKEAEKFTNIMKIKSLASTEQVDAMLMK